METIAQNVQIGTVLYFDESSYNHAKSTAKRGFLPACNDLITAYQQVGSKEPITTELLHELVNSGTDKIRTKLEAMISKDLSVFQSPITKQAFLQQIESFQGPLDQAIATVKNSLLKTNSYSTSGYSFSIDDVLIENGQAVLNEAAMIPFFTTRIENENQLTAYQLLSELADLYNRTKRFIMANQRRPVDRILGTYLNTAEGGDVKTNPQAIPNIK